MRRCRRRRQQGPTGRRGDGEKPGGRAAPRRGRYRQQGGGYGMGAPHGIRDANSGPARVAGSGRDRLADAGRGDHLMIWVRGSRSRDRLAQGSPFGMLARSPPFAPLLLDARVTTAGSTTRRRQKSKVAARPNCEVTQHRTLTLLPQQQSRNEHGASEQHTQERTYTPGEGE